MKTKDVVLLLILSAMWGGSFLFIRVASLALGPIVLIELRVLIAGLALLAYALATSIKLEVKKFWKQYAIIGLINSAIPFTLIATAELNLSAGYAAILNATTPLFGAVVAAAWIKEPLTLKKLLGLFLGLAGVTVVFGLNSLSMTTVIIFSIGASVLAAAFYGFAGVYSKVKGKGMRSYGLATCSLLAAAIWLLPFVPFAWPSGTVDFSVVMSVLALAFLSTALGYVIYFGLIESAGPTRTLTVTFLAPVFGIVWGIVFLSEVLTLTTVIGFGIVLVGTFFVTGFSFKRAK